MKLNTLLGAWRLGAGTSNIRHARLLLRPTHPTPHTRRAPPAICAFLHFLLCVSSSAVFAVCPLFYGCTFWLLLLLLLLLQACIFTVPRSCWAAEDRRGHGDVVVGVVDGLATDASPMPTSAATDAEAMASSRVAGGMPSEMSLNPCT